MIALGVLADKYGMEAVVAAVDGALVRVVTAETCGEVLCWSRGNRWGQLPRAVAASRMMALERFELVSRSGGFKAMSEEMMCELVSDDALAAEEAVVLDAVLEWIAAGDGKGRGERLLGEIRYGLLEISFLAEMGQKAGQGTRLHSLVHEALSLKQHQGRLQVRPLSLRGKAFLCRKGMDIAWEDYAKRMRKPQVVRGKSDAKSLAHARTEGGGEHWRVYAGLYDGKIVSWDQSTLRERQGPRIEGAYGCVSCITVLEDLVISRGPTHGSLRVWNTMTGHCDRVLRGHTGPVSCVASWGHFLVSGSLDCTVKIWEMGGDVSWPCLSTIAVHTKSVWDVVVWKGRVISGSDDQKLKLCVCDIATGQLEAALDAHKAHEAGGGVCALAVHGDKLLFSAALDQTIGVWGLGTWQLLCRFVLGEHVPNVSHRGCLCLAMSGSKLLCGGSSITGEGFLLVLNPDTMACEHRLPLDDSPTRLLSLDQDQVWGVVGRNVVVWGKPKRGQVA